jgi:hypothetical protein
LLVLRWCAARSVAIGWLRPLWVLTFVVALPGVVWGVGAVAKDASAMAGYLMM